MGEVIHCAVIVTGIKIEIMEEIHAFAKSLDLDISEIQETGNWYKSFMVLPHGMKLGGEDDLEYFEKRQQLKEKLKSYAWQVDWVEVEFGDYDCRAQVLAEGNYLRD